MLGTNRVVAAWTRRSLGILVLPWALGCGTTATRAPSLPDALLDPTATGRTAAVAEVSRQGDVAQVPRLIELLDDEDEAVRLAAGATLTDLTGRDTGYRAWASPAERRAQVLQWRSWWTSRSRGGTAPGEGRAP